MYSCKRVWCCLMAEAVLEIVAGKRSEDWLDTDMAEIISDHSGTSLSYIRRKLKEGAVVNPHNNGGVQKIRYATYAAMGAEYTDILDAGVFASSSIQVIHRSAENKGVSMIKANNKAVRWNQLPDELVAKEKYETYGVAANVSFTQALKQRNWILSKALRCKKKREEKIDYGQLIRDLPSPI